MDQRTQAFLTDFLERYNRAAELANWRHLSQNSEKDMAACPRCICNYRLQIHDHGLQEAKWPIVFLVTEIVFTKHGVRCHLNPDYECWSLKNLLENIEFEEGSSRQDVTAAGEP